MYRLILTLPSIAVRKLVPSTNQPANPNPKNNISIYFPSYRYFTSQRPTSTIWAKYDAAVQKSPLLIKGLTSGFLACIADIVCQFAFPPKDKVSNPMDWKQQLNNYDFMRTIKFTIIGAVYTAPSLHYWYGGLGRLFPGNGFSSVSYRLVLDQTVFAPTFLSIFFAGLWFLDGETPTQVFDKLQKTLVPTLITNYSVWVPAQLINFCFVPAHLQVLYANAIGFFWNIYLSYAGNQAQAQQQYDQNDVIATSVKK
jgi:protein Mpv17